MILALEKFCDSMLPTCSHGGETAACDLNSKVDCPYAFISTASLSPFEPPTRGGPGASSYPCPATMHRLLTTCWVGASDTSR